MTSSLAVIPRDWSYPILESRSGSLENPSAPLGMPAEWMLDIFNGGRTDSGIRVSELTAFQVVTFLACIDLIAGKISSLPLHVYERSLAANGRAIHKISYEHEYYDLVHLEPNPEMSRATFLKAAMYHALAWSNAYAEIQRDASNQAVAFWPRNPAKTRPIRLPNAVTLDPQPWRPFPVTIPAGALAYDTTDGLEDQDQSEVGARGLRNRRIIAREDMLHLPGISFDGRIGQSIVWLARQTLGLALATEKFGSKYFANFAKPGGILTMPMNMQAVDREKAKQSWLEAQGGENAHRVAVMPPGFDFKAMSHNAQEAQTIETRAYLRNEIAALLHVPSRMVGDSNSRASRATVEQENQEFLDYTLSPLMTLITLEFKRKLFPHARIGRRPKNPYYVDFDISAMIRGDASSREKFNASGKQWGYLNTNDVRALENLNPIEEPWAEQYWMPVNMTLVKTPVDPTFQDGSGKGTKPDVDLGEDPLRSLDVYYPLFWDGYNRILERKNRDAAALHRCFGGALKAIAIERARANPGGALSPGFDAFMESYCEQMAERARQWTAENEHETARKELEMAAEEIGKFVFRA